MMVVNIITNTNNGRGVFRTLVVVVGLWLGWWLVFACLP